MMRVKIRLLGAETGKVLLFDESIDFRALLRQVVDKLEAADSGGGGGDVDVGAAFQLRLGADVVLEDAGEVRHDDDLVLVRIGGDDTTKRDAAAGQGRADDARTTRASATPQSPDDASGADEKAAASLPSVPEPDPAARKPATAAAGDANVARARTHNHVSPPSPGNASRAPPAQPSLGARPSSLKKGRSVSFNCAPDPKTEGASPPTNPSLGGGPATTGTATGESRRRPPPAPRDAVVCGCFHQWQSTRL